MPPSAERPRTSGRLGPDTVSPLQAVPSSAPPCSQSCGPGSPLGRIAQRVSRSLAHTEGRSVSRPVLRTCHLLLQRGRSEGYPGPRAHQGGAGVGAWQVRSRRGLCGLTLRSSRPATAGFASLRRRLSSNVRRCKPQPIAGSAISAKQATSPARKRVCPVVSPPTPQVATLLPYRQSPKSEPGASPQPYSAATLFYSSPKSSLQVSWYWALQYGSSACFFTVRFCQPWPSLPAFPRPRLCSCLATAITQPTLPISAWPVRSSRVGMSAHGLASIQSAFIA